MKKNISLGILLALIIFMGVVIVFHSRNNESQTNLQKNIDNSTPSTANTVTVAINTGDGNPKNFTTKFIDTMTAYDALTAAAKNANVELKTKNYDLGIFIEQIGEVKNGDKGKYWLYYINGKPPSIAADKQILKPGDNIEFKFEKSPY